MLRASECIHEITVHVLHHGLPLCRFSTGAPVFWPDGHRWVGLDDPDPVTCTQCIAVKASLG